MSMTLRIFHSLLRSTQWILNVVNEAEVFLEFPCFLQDPVNVGGLFSDSSSFSKASFYN